MLWPCGAAGLSAYTQPVTKSEPEIPAQPKSNGHDAHKPSLITDVAKLANVSTATVSRVLNTPEVVAPATADRVREAMSELRYRPNIFAKGLVSRTSRVLGIIMPDFLGEFYTQLLQSADTAAREHGYHVVVTSDTRLGSADAVQSLPLNFLDGIIALLTFPDRKLTKSLVDQNMPMVLIDTEEGLPGIDRIRIENEPGSRQAATHLLETVAPKDCFHVGGPATNFDAKDRAKAFNDVLSQEAGSVDKHQIVFGDFSADWGYEWGLANLPARRDKITGVFAGNDEIALGVMSAASEVGISIPSQLRIVGFDGTRICDIIRPALSSVAVPFELIGRSAVELCLSRIAEPSRKAETIPAETHLVVRESSKP